MYNYFDMLFENIHILSEVWLNRKGLFAYLALSSASDPSSDRGCVEQPQDLASQQPFPKYKHD
jgi:hypothetical protein